MDKEMARTDTEPKAEKTKAKATAGKKGKSEPEADLLRSVKNIASSKDEALPDMSALPNKGRKRRKTMLNDNELDFKATEAPMKSAPIVLATRSRQATNGVNWISHFGARWRSTLSSFTDSRPWRIAFSAPTGATKFQR